MLSPQEQIKYQRQIMLSPVQEQGQLALKRAKILIVGLGGLGHPVSMYLAAAGVGQLFLADGDNVDTSNLQRQVLFTPDDVGQNKADLAAEKLTQQNNDIEVEAIDEMLDEETAQYYISLVDVVIDCTDNIKTRLMLNRLTYEQNKTLISGAATGLDGQCFVLKRNTSTQPQSGCYQCLIPSEQDAPTQNCSTLGILGPILGVIGSMQALMAIKVIIEAQQDSHKLMVFDGMSQQWQTFNMTANSQCPVCRQ